MFVSFANTNRKNEIACSANPREGFWLAQIGCHVGKDKFSFSVKVNWPSGVALCNIQYHEEAYAQWGGGGGVFHMYDNHVFALKAVSIAGYALTILGQHFYFKFLLSFLLLINAVTHLFALVAFSVCFNDSRMLYIFILRGVFVLYVYPSEERDLYFIARCLC